MLWVYPKFCVNFRKPVEKSKLIEALFAALIATNQKSCSLTRNFCSPGMNDAPILPPPGPFLRNVHHGEIQRFSTSPKAGFPFLAAVTIPGVICSLVLEILFAVTEFFIQLRFPSVLHKFCDGLPEQALDICHAGEPARESWLAARFLPECGSFSTYV